VSASAAAKSVASRASRTLVARRHTLQRNRKRRHGFEPWIGIERHVAVGLSDAVRADRGEVVERAVEEVRRLDLARAR
jgi:hypothetical protein